jgi:hypothetical protein
MSTMKAVGPRKLIASIHDVSPRFESEIDRLLDLLRPHVGSKLALLVVPNHWNEAPIVGGSPFASRLRGWADEGMEIFLHGYFHRDDCIHRSVSDRFRARLMTASEGEFLGLSREAAAELIHSGRALIEDVTGSPVAGFVAPAWLYGRGALEALARCGIRIAESHWNVWSPLTGARLAFGPVITWASRTRARAISSVAAAAALRRAPMRVLRVGVHPPDVAKPALLRSIERTLSIGSHSREVTSYSDLLKASSEFEQDAHRRPSRAGSAAVEPPVA